MHICAKSGCKKVTLFGNDCDDGVSACIWVIHTGAKSRRSLIFGSDCDDGVSAFCMGHTYRCQVKKVTYFWQ